MARVCLSGSTGLQGTKKNITISEAVDTLTRVDGFLDTLEEEKRLRDEFPAVRSAYEDYQLLIKMYRK